ncbi:MAG: hypothetical protein JST89_21405 [Cyanobacteria bacterium SZAS-4]|nr:hypothetical protein [Cyanobacteria bacterium SZAS-4]
MTNDWNNFSIGKVEPKDSTTPTPAVPLGTTLNLASLRPNDRPAGPAAPVAPAGSGTFMDAAGGFMTGMGKQAVGTVDSLLGMDNVLLKKNIAMGGSGTTAEGVGWMPVAGKLIHGVSETVSVAWHNPGAIMAIPGQIAQQWNNGDMRTRGDIAGQATFIIGSLFVGGSGAAKAGNIAGDVREASVLSKGMTTLGETGNTVRTLETTVTGLRGSNLVADASNFGKTGLMADAAGLTRTTALAGDVTAEAGLLTRGAGVLDQTANGLIRTGSFTEKVLPATEGATKFLVKGGETASSLGLGEMSMPNRLLGLQTTEQGAGVVSKFLSRFKAAPELETSLGTTVQSIPKFGKGAALTEDLAAAGRVADFTTDAGKLTGLTSDLSHAGTMGRAATDAEKLLAGGAGKVEALGTNAGKVEALGTNVGRVETFGAKAETLGVKAETLGVKAETVGGKVETLGGAGRLTETVAPQAVRAEHAVQTAEQLAPHIDQFAEQARLLRTTENLGAHSTPLAELETGLTKFKTAAGAGERAEALTQLNKTVSALEAQGVETSALRSSLTRLQAETQTIERVSQLRTATTQIAEHSTTLTSQTAELTTKFGGRASVQELEQATKQLAQAKNAGETAQALGAVEKATAKVIADLPAESTAALRTTVESLRAPVQFAAKAEAAEAVATQFAERSASLTKQVSELTTSPAVRELDVATKQLAQAGSAADRAQALSAVERASAKVMTEVPAETATALRTTIESLKTPVQAALRSEVADVAAAQIVERTSALTEQTTQIAAKYGSKASVQELSNATKAFNEAETFSEKARALGAVERATARVANEIPEAGASLTKTVESLRAPVQTAVKVEQTEMVAAQIAERSNQLAAETSQLAAKFAENPAVREMSTASREFAQAKSAVEQAEAYAKMEKAAAAVKELGPEGAKVARTVESLGAPVETAARAQRIENAVVQVEERVGSLTTQTKSLVTELAAEGKVPASVRDLDAAAARLQQATTASEKAEAFAAVQKSATEVATELPGKSAQITKTVESIAPHVEQAERLTQFENVSSKLAYHADDVAKEASLLKATNSTLKSEAALADLQTSASTFKAATATERTEQLAQMNKNLRLVEAEVGEAKVAGLRTSVARLENEAGTFERMATVDKSVAQVSEQSQSLIRQVAELDAKTTNAAVKLSLENLRTAATETGTANALSRTELLAQHAKDIAVVEREMGTIAGGQMRTAVAELDRATAAARSNAIELVEYQGAKITQQLGYLQEGNLGSRVQALRLEQLQHDVAVMKSMVSANAEASTQLLKLEQQIKGVDAVANILAHPEVARAPGKELLRLAQSADSATATAAADRLVLSGKYEKLGEGPVSGLISERAQFWNTQNKLTALEDTVKTKLFESGKLFGLPFGDPILKKTLFDIAAASGGILLLDGVAGYNLNKIAAMARDNVLSAQAEAQARKDDQPKKEAEVKPTEVKTTNAQGQTISNTTQASNSGNSNAVANVQATRASDNTGSETYTRTSQQVVFKSDAQEVKMSPVAQVYATPKFLASEETNNIPAGSFPTSGASWWWKQQHGGNPWGFNRGPGAAPVVQEDVKQSVQITPRARGIAATPQDDLTKIAQVRFPIPRVMDITNQAMLLNSPNQFSSKAGRPGGVGGTGGGTRSWATVDWSQIGAHRSSTSEGGKGNKDLANLEKDEEQGIDGAGGTVTAQNQPGIPVLAQNANDPNAVDPNDPNSVVALNAQQKKDDDNFAKV